MFRACLFLFIHPTAINPTPICLMFILGLFYVVRTPIIITLHPHMLCLLFLCLFYCDYSLHHAFYYSTPMLVSCSFWAISDFVPLF